jgi:hypothetical protein
MAKLYRPRMALRLTVPLPQGGAFQPITFDVPVVRARLESNDHNRADTLSVTLDWVDTGVDPRWISGATCEFYLGPATDAGQWQPSEKDLRFVGRLVKPARKGKGDTLSVECEFHDYTSFFLVAKPVATSAIPGYSDRLDEAWAKLCVSVPGAGELADNLDMQGFDEWPVLGAGVAARFKKRGSLQTEPKVDAWAVWQQAVGQLGLITYFLLDRCIVTTAEDYYTGADPPRIVWGLNLLDFTEERNNDRVQKGVILQSYDPIGGRTLESIYPPETDARIQALVPKKGSVSARPRKKPPKVDLRKEYDVFQYAGVTDQATLDAVAQRVYAERSKQELEGTVVTKDMDAATASGATFDLLDLRSGDTIEIRFLDTRDAEFVALFSSVGDRVTYLVGLGYTEPVAQIIATNVSSLSSKSSQFYCKTVTTSVDSEGDSGSFAIEIAYCNKIAVDGGADTSADTSGD